MFKKVLVVAVIAAVAVVAVRHTRMGSLARQEAVEFRDWVESQVPPEAEIKRLRGEIKLLEEDALKLTKLLATENVDVRNLRLKTADDRASLARDADLLVARGQAIKAAKAANSTEKVSYGSEALPVDVATQRLAADRSRYDANKKSVEAMEMHLAARERNREALEKQFKTLQLQQQEMDAAVNRLEAELNILKVQQMESKYQADDTRLSGIKESIRGMQRKIDIQRESLKMAPNVYEAPTATPTGGKSVDEILSGLGDAPKAEKKITNAD